MPNPYVNKVQKSNGDVLIDLSTDTVSSAADIVSGKVGHLRDGSVVTGTASGGGGASNLVTGTFKGTTTGAAMDVTLNYSGSGYPISFMIFPTQFGFSSTAYNIIQRYMNVMFAGAKRDPATVPTYATTGEENQFYFVARYKNSASSSTAYGNYGSASTAMLTGTAATNTNSGGVRFKDSKTLSVYIPVSGSDYGFAANIEYTYQIIYSS